MLTGGVIVQILDVVVPLYICIAMGFTSSRMGILPYEQYHLGISGFDSLFAVPFLVFRMVASNNPYTMNLKLIQVDITSKVSILLVLCLSYFYRSTHHQVAWISSLFHFFTMPNSILIGTPLLNALFPDVASNISTLVFLQCMLWFNVCIFILEVYKALYEDSDEFEAAQTALQWELSKSIISKRSIGVLAGISVDNVDMVREDDPSDDLLAISEQLPIILPSSPTAANNNNLPFDGSNPDHGDCDGEQQETVILAEPDIMKKVTTTTKLQAAKKIMRTVLTKFTWSPVAWASILGLFYSLFISSKHMNGKQMPQLLNNLVNMMANCALGLSMFMLGMHAGASSKIFACGVQLALLGAFVRFIISPALSALVSYAVGLRGDMFRFSVMQAMVPQATLSFVWASQYNVHVDLFNTAVWFQTVTFLPFAIAIDALLEVDS